MAALEKDNEDVREFAVEAKDSLDAAEQSLLALEAGMNFADHYDTIFRCFHNIKGAAGMLELIDLQNYVHELETVLVKLKDNGRAESHFVEYFLRGVDGIRQILSGQTVPPLAPPVEGIKAAVKLPTPDLGPDDKKICFVGVARETLKGHLPARAWNHTAFYTVWSEVPDSLSTSPGCIFVAGFGAGEGPNRTSLRFRSQEPGAEELEWLKKLIEVELRSWSLENLMQRMADRAI